MLPLRNGVILGLTLGGAILLTLAVAEDRMAAEMVAAAGVWLVAWVYAQVTKR